MKILQFGFDTDGNNEFLPHNYNRNCVVYTGTHDNSTIQGWYKEIDEHTKKMVETYINDDGHLFISICDSKSIYDIFDTEDLAKGSMKFFEKFEEK